MQERFLVHTREGQPCPGADCDGVVERIVVSGRSTYFCPSCQVKLRKRPKRRKAAAKRVRS
jgi:formamidopyrimidine-DNA glycosylase